MTRNDLLLFSIKNKYINTTQTVLFVFIDGQYASQQRLVIINEGSLVSLEMFTFSKKLIDI